MDAGAAAGASGAASGWPGGGGTYTWTNVGGRPSPAGGASDFDIGSIFEEMFGGSSRGGSPFGGAGSGAKARGRPSRGRDLSREIEVSFPTAMNGGTETLRVRRGGASQTIDVRIPAGSEDGAKLRVRGAGSPSAGGGAPGDLILTLRVGEHPVFRREGDDLIVDLPLTIAEATLGARVSVPTLSGRATLTVPPGTSSGQQLRMRGLGVEREGQPKGDLRAVARIVAPKDLPASDLEALRELGARLPPARSGPPWDG